MSMRPLTLWDTKTARLTTGVRTSAATRTRRAANSLQMAHHIATLRRQRGYSGTRYDVSVDRTPNTLRCQFGRFYDAKKARNNFAAA